jgi:hypothetical protein
VTWWQALLMAEVGYAARAGLSAVRTARRAGVPWRQAVTNLIDTANPAKPARERVPSVEELP